MILLQLLLEKNKTETLSWTLLEGSGRLTPGFRPSIGDKLSRRKNSARMHGTGKEIIIHSFNYIAGVRRRIELACQQTLVLSPISMLRSPKGLFTLSPTLRSGPHSLTVGKGLDSLNFYLSWTH